MKQQTRYQTVKNKLHSKQHKNVFIIMIWQGEEGGESYGLFTSAQRNIKLDGQSTIPAGKAFHLETARGIKEFLNALVLHEKSITFCRDKNVCSDGYPVDCMMFCLFLTDCYIVNRNISFCPGNEIDPRYSNSAVSRSDDGDLRQLYK